MERNAKPKREVIAEIKKRIFLQVTAALFVVFIMFSVSKTDDALVALILFPVIISFAYFTHKNWRCPSCNGWLGQCKAPQCRGKAEPGNKKK